MVRNYTCFIYNLSVAINNGHQKRLLELFKHICLVRKFSGLCMLLLIYFDPKFEKLTYTNYILFKAQFGIEKAIRFYKCTRHLFSSNHFFLSMSRSGKGQAPRIIPPPFVFKQAIIIFTSIDIKTFLVLSIFILHDSGGTIVQHVDRKLSGAFRYCIAEIICPLVS